MRIIHIHFSGIFTEDMNYHTNGLAECNALDGNETIVITSCLSYQDGVIVKNPPSDKVIKENLRVIRMPYRNPMTDIRFQKIRSVKGLYRLLTALEPDIIYIDGTSFWSIRDVVRYKKDHPKVKLFADSHAAADNSGKNWFSLHVLHQMFYRHLTQMVIPYVDKYFYIGKVEKDFAIECYGVPESIMEFYPLGGYIPNAEEYTSARKLRRDELCVEDDELLFVHAGKLEPQKRTEELLRAFLAVPGLHAKLAIIGSMPDEVRERVMPLIKSDDRVIYLGWKTSDELRAYLCACDLYLQPGKPSAVLQNAVCCGCPVLSYPHESYKEDFDYQNFIWAETSADLIGAFQSIESGKVDLTALRHNSERCACELLDYRVLARRIYK